MEKYYKEVHSEKPDPGGDDSWPVFVPTSAILVSCVDQTGRANIIPLTGFGVGRYGIRSYMKRGYVSSDNAMDPQNPFFIASYVFNQGASRTLEYSYDDFCVSWMAKELGYGEDHEYFKKRALNYKNVFDNETGFVRGRSVTGKWMNERDFNPGAYYA